MMFTATHAAEEDGPEAAQAFFESIGQKQLIVEDVSELSPEELQEMIHTTHDFCRHGKALRLHNARQMASEMGIKSTMEASQLNWDALYYEINFGIDFDFNTINGYVRTHAASLTDGLNLLELNLVDALNVDSAVMNGTQLSFSHSSNLVSITLDGTYDTNDTFSVYLYYNGTPSGGGFQGFEFGSHGGYEIASTLSEPYSARSWWPCKDYPEDKADSVDIIITHPDNFVCASNGLVESIVDNGDGTKTTHWKHKYPIATYLVAIGVTNYVEFREWYVAENGDSMPVDFYVYPENLNTAQVYYPVTVDMIDTLAPLFGEYPFIDEKYGTLQFNWGGGMEHQTNTSLSSNAYYQSIIAHELGHQWWGDMITCEDFHEIWLNEGFATYTEALWFEATEGSAFYHDYMNGMAYTNSGTIWCQDTSDVWSIFTSRVYDKGAWFLHMLRNWVGDSTFFSIFDAYYNDVRYKWGTINSVQFRDLCIDVSGDSNLSDFFDDWIWGEKYPLYRYSYDYEEYEPGKFVLYVHIRQTQTTNPQVFDMPIDLRFPDGVTTHEFRVYNDQREQDFILWAENVSNYPYAIYFDQDDWILKNASGEGYGYHVIYDPIDTATQYQPYEDSVIVRGGTEPYQFYKISGDLPDGVNVDLNSGKISGTPAEFGDFQFAVRVEDASVPTKAQQVQYNLTVEEYPLMVGDANFDGGINVSDAVWIINFVFAAGPEPQPVMESGDANCDGEVNVSDAVWIINYVFTGGPAPGDC